MLEVGVDIGLGLGLGDAQALGEPEGADAVDDAVIDGLGRAAEIGADLGHRLSEHLRRRDGVDVDVVREGLFQCLDIGHVGQDTKLDLRIVGRQKKKTGSGKKSLADLAAFLGTDRDVLQVRLGRAEAAGRGRGQHVAGVDAAGRGADLLDQRVGVGAGELLQLPPVEDDAGQRVAGDGQLLQHLGPGGVGAGFRLSALAAQRHLVEQDLAQLLGRAEVEGAAGELDGLLLELGHALGEDAGELVEAALVDGDAAHLHRRQHRWQRPLQRLVDRGQPLLEEAGLEVLPEAQRDGGMLARMVGGLLGRHLGEADARRTLAAHGLPGGGVVVEETLGDLVQAMAVAGAVQDIGQQHRVLDRGQGDAVASQHGHGVLDVVADLEDRGVDEDGLQSVQHHRSVELTLEPPAEGVDVGQGEIEALGGVDGEAEADQLGAADDQRGPERVEGEAARLQGLFDQRVELVRA